jgi:hypothetical protein
MKGHYRKTRHPSLCFLQGIIYSFINIFLCFLEYFKRIYIHLLPSNEDLRSTLAYPSLQTIDSPSSCITDIHHDPSFELYDVQGQFCKPNKVKIDLVSYVLTPSPSKIQERYKPLRLPSILHDIPPKHYKYLPMFDENITAEKHDQAFENFAYFFEIEHDDVSMRIFSQSLQGYAKVWFRHLHPKSISSWEELSHAFLRFWGERKSWD